MKRKSHKKKQKAGAGQIAKGLLLGSVVGATVGWLTAPAAGEETRRRLRGDMMNAREKAKTAEGNVESRARELAQNVSNELGSGETPATGRKRTSSVGS